MASHARKEVVCRVTTMRTSNLTWTVQHKTCQARLTATPFQCESRSLQKLVRKPKRQISFGRPLCRQADTSKMNLIHNGTKINSVVSGQGTAACYWPLGFHKENYSLATWLSVFKNYALKTRAPAGIFLRWCILTTQKMARHLMINAGQDKTCMSIKNLQELYEI